MVLDSGKIEMKNIFFGQVLHSLTIYFVFGFVLDEAIHIWKKKNTYNLWRCMYLYKSNIFPYQILKLCFRKVLFLQLN